MLFKVTEVKVEDGFIRINFRRADVGEMEEYEDFLVSVWRSKDKLTIIPKEGELFNITFVPLVTKKEASE